MEIDASSYDSEMLSLMKVKNQNGMTEEKDRQAHKKGSFKRKCEEEKRRKQQKN